VSSLNRWLPRVDYSAAERLALRVAAALALALGVCAWLLATDSRTLDTGESVWLKPIRFCLAFGVHLLTMVWIGRLSAVRERGDSAYAAGLWLQAVIVVVEVVCIALQAARGVHSHFNYATPFDRAVFTVMGIGTGFTLLGLLVCALGVWRATTARLTRRVLLGGMALAVMGGLVGVLMVMPTDQQRALLSAGVKLPWVGGSAVGIPSGQRMPFFHWDLHAGDWRTVHFVGLHALQALPLLAWLATRGGSGPTPRAKWSATVGAWAYAALVVAVAAWTASGRSMLALSAPGWWIVGAPLAVFAAATLMLSWPRRIGHVG
jgi:hypothetical protein